VAMPLFQTFTFPHSHRPQKSTLSQNSEAISFQDLPQYPISSSNRVLQIVLSISRLCSLSLTICSFLHLLHFLKHLKAETLVLTICSGCCSHSLSFSSSHLTQYVSHFLSHSHDCLLRASSAPRSKPRSKKNPSRLRLNPFPPNP
jgi:hypothetical protein